MTRLRTQRRKEWLSANSRRSHRWIHFGFQWRAHSILPGTDNISIASLAEYLAIRLGQPVVDNTGIAGDEASAENDPDAAPLPFTALQETLGLRLQTQKVSVNVVVVDHMERAPTEK